MLKVYAISGSGCSLRVVSGKFLQRLLAAADAPDSAATIITPEGADQALQKRSMFTKSVLAAVVNALNGYGRMWSQCRINVSIDALSWHLQQS